MIWVGRLGQTRHGRTLRSKSVLRLLRLSFVAVRSTTLRLTRPMATTSDDPVPPLTLKERIKALQDAAARTSTSTSASTSSSATNAAMTLPDQTRTTSTVELMNDLGITERRSTSSTTRSDDSTLPPSLSTTMSSNNPSMKGHSSTSSSPTISRSSTPSSPSTSRPSIPPRPIPSTLTKPTISDPLTSTSPPTSITPSPTTGPRSDLVKEVPKLPPRRSNTLSSLNSNQTNAEPMTGSLGLRPELPPRRSIAISSSGSISSITANSTSTRKTISTPPPPSRANYIPKYQKPTSSKTADSVKNIPSSVSSVHSIQNANKRYEDLFEVLLKYQNGGKELNGNIVRIVWRKSRLGEENLKMIWTKVDLEKRGTLNKEAFCSGMRMIDEELANVRQGDLRLRNR